MKLKFLILMLIPISCFANHESYMKTYLPQVEAHLEKDFPGPIARELGSMALARQILEDGLNKGSGYSVAGIGVGKPNSEIVTAKLFEWLKVGRATDYEGGTFYSFKGPQANICSAVIIAYLFDQYVGKFLPKLESKWEMAKSVSKELDENDCVILDAIYDDLDPSSILERTNRMYGPNAEGVLRIRRLVE